MPKVDNDPTKKVAQPFVIIAGVRCGGTFLAHCLSNHPAVFCDRGESMHEHSVWRQHKVEAGTLLYLLTHQEGYHASGFRMVYSQAFSKHVWRAIVELKPRVIHLTRANVLRQAGSLIFHRLVRAHKAQYHPVHSFEEVGEPPAVSVQPAQFIKTCAELARAAASAADRLAETGLSVLPVEYAEMVGGEGKQTIYADLEIARKICNHIGVCEYPLTCELKRVHNHPLKVMFENWHEIEQAVAHSDFAYHLEHEMAWRRIGGKWEVRDG